MSDWRIGKFRIGADWLMPEHQDKALAVLRGVLVLEAVRVANGRAVQYTGFHHSFRPIPHGGTVPTYEFEILEVGEGMAEHLEVRWREERCRIYPVVDAPTGILSSVTA